MIESGTTYIEKYLTFQKVLHISVFAVFVEEGCMVEIVRPRAGLEEIKDILILPLLGANLLAETVGEVA